MFSYTEPASNMAANSLGIRITENFMKEYKAAKERSDKKKAAKKTKKKAAKKAAGKAKMRKAMSGHY